MRFLGNRVRILLAALFVTSVVPCLADDPQPPVAKKAAVKIIKPDDAKQYDGKEVTVEFKVAAARELDSGVCFLNSSTDRNDPKRFTAFINAKGLKKFKEDPKTEKPADYFSKKTLRVTGTIKLYRAAYEIEVSSPEQIAIVEEEKKKS
jgi:hypothetical protein